MSTYQISGPWRGNLSIVSRPRGGDWLEDDARAWKNEGLDAIVSLLTLDEQREFDLTRERNVIEEQGLRFFWLPINDMGVPAARHDALALLKQVEKLLGTGESVGIHCRQGIGRSSLIAACLLIMSGASAKNALAAVTEARGLPVPETSEQRKWIEDFELEFASSVAHSK